MRDETMHKQFLLAALEQAWFGRGFCAPNPSVGAVAVQHGNMIARSWHHGAGTAHAETLLLDQLPKDCTDITVYVTLEPCNHWGRTPPCVDALIQYGVKQVVYAYSDPNPRVSENNTPRLLKAQGITVLHYPLPEIDRFYQSYRHWIITHKPWVTVKIAQTFDGKIAAAQGARAHLSNALCAEFTHEHRLHSDIILTTARTVNQDDPLLNVRLSGREFAKLVAIIDSQLTLNPNAKVLTEAEHCLIYHDAERPVGHHHANCSFYPMPTLADSRLDLNAIIHHLGSLGYHDVWVEAGSELFNALHEAGLVNRTYIYLVPNVLGEAAVAAYRNKDVLNGASAVTWQAMGDNMIACFDWQEDLCLPD